MGFGTGNLGMGINFTLNNQASVPAAAAGKSITNLSNTVHTAGMKINNSASMITTGLIGVSLVEGALLGPFAGITKAAASFDSVMSELSAKGNLEKSSLAMAEMRKQAIDLGDATKFSALEVGEGQTFLAMAGFNSNKILTSMPGLLSLAAAGNLGLARSADIASNTMAQFGLQAADMAHISDVLANAATSSNQNIEQFAQGMKFLGPTASALGMSLEEASATMMVLANAGLQSSLGTRALGTSLGARLTGAMGNAEDAMERIGLRAFDANENFVGMEETIRRFAKATEDMTQKQRIKNIVQIFGGESLQEVTTLMKGQVEVMREGEKVTLRGADAIGYFTQKNIEAAGAAEMMAKRMLDNLAGDMVKFKSVMETTAIVAGGSLAEALRPVVQLGTEFLKLTKRLLATPLGQWFVKVAAGVAALAAGLIISGFVITVLTPAIWGMVTAAWALLVPLLPIILAFAGITAAIVLATKSYQMFTDVLAGTETKTGFLGFMQRLGGRMQAGVQIWKTWNGETFALTENMHDSLQRLGILDEVLTFGTWIVRIKEFYTGLSEGLEEAWSKMEPVLDRMWGSINRLFEAITSVKLEFTTLDGDIRNFEDLGKLFSSFIDNYFITPLEMLFSSISFLFDLLSDVLGLRTAFATEGVHGVAKKIIGDIEKGEAGPLIKFAANVGEFTGAADRLKLSGAFAGNPALAIGGYIASKFANQSVAPDPTIIDKSVTTQGDVTAIVNLDGEEVGKALITKDQLNDNRN